LCKKNGKNTYVKRLEDFLLLVEVVTVLRNFRFTGLGCSDGGRNALIST
jgi:hypothetical protein